jgi:hypothetical protein
VREHPRVNHQGTGPLDQLVDATRLAHPDALPAAVAEAARALGVTDAVIWLADYEQASLVAVPSKAWLGVYIEDARVPIDGTAAGRCFREGVIVTQVDEEGHRVWVPMHHGTERIGALSALLQSDDVSATEALARFTDVVGAQVIRKSGYGDVFYTTRRRREMSLAAEIQWGLLPPLSTASAEVSVAGILEPTYSVGGDVFDYAINAGVLQFAILDAMGHGINASMISTISLNAYRHARRLGANLADTVAEVDAAIHRQFEGGFATGLFAELDLAGGSMRWVGAAHPFPLLLRNGDMSELPCPPALPLGVKVEFGLDVVVNTAELCPGDGLFLYTDGVIDRAGEPFGLGGLITLLTRLAAEVDNAAELVRRTVRAVVSHHGDVLDDDASILHVHWLGPDADPG